MAPSKEHDPSGPSKDVSKAGKKRKSTGDSKAVNDGKAPSNKKPKPEFTEIEFKFLLRDEDQTVTALEKFCQCVKEGPYDLISNYAKSSPEANEIIVLLENQNNTFRRRKPEELALIFSSLNLILSRSYLGETNSAVKEQATFIAKKLLSNHLPIMYYVMHKSAKKAVLIACLKLLTSIILQGQRISLDAVLSFDFQNDNFKGLFMKKYTSESNDIRSSLVHLVMSFLMTDDTLVIKHLCDTGVLASLFPLLASDSAKNVQVILSTLRDKVVMNSDVTKSAKLKIFTANSLTQLAALYKWKPPSGKRSNAGESKPEYYHDVRNWVHSFLLELCCSQKHGISFYDPQYGTTNANPNQHLWHFLCQFGEPHKDHLRKELISKILSACPDLVAKYLSRLHSAIYPRESAVWLSAMHLITNIFESQTMLKVFTAKVLLPTDKLVTIALSVLLPPKDVANQINLAVKHESVMCNFMAFRLLKVILKKMKETLDYCMEEASLLKDDPNSMAPRLVDFVENFKKQAILPSLSGLMLSCKASLQTAQLGKVDIDPKEHKDDLSTVNVLYHLTLVMEVMGYYGCFASKAAPDFVTLLSGMQSLCQSDMVQDSDNQAAMAGMKKALLHLVSTFNSSILQAKQSECGDSMIHMLFKVSQPEATDDDDTWIDMLAQLLSNSGYFGDSSDEITVWLNCLQENVSGRKGNLSFDDKCAFVSRCVQAVLKDPYSYSERVVRVNQEATEMGIEMEESSTQQYNALVRDILSQPQVEIVAYSQEITSECMQTDEEATPSSIFTGLMPAAMDIVSASHSKADRSCFLHIVQHVLRIQCDPLPLALMVSRVDDSLLKQSPALCSALATLLPKSMHKEWSSLAPTDEATTFGDLIESIFTTKLEWEDDQKWLSMLPLKPRERRMAVKQLLQYITILLSKSKEKAKSRNILQALFQFLLQIVERMSYEAKFESTKTEVKEEDAGAHTVDVSSNLLTVSSLIFQHDGIRKHFADHSSIWFELVTKSLGKLVAAMPVRILEQTVHLTHFKEKLISAMPKKENTVVMETFGQLLASMNGKELASSVQTLLKFKLTTKGKLSDLGEKFLAAMQAIAKDKSILTDHALPMDALTALFDLVIELGLDAMTATACELLTVAPLYSVCVAESHCLKLIDRSSTSEDCMKISRLLIQHSPVARRWVGRSLIAKFERDQDFVQENVHILDPYLRFASEADLRISGEKLFSLCWKRLVKLLRSKLLEGEAFGSALTILLRLASLTEEKLESKFEKLHEDLMSSFEATFFTVDVIDTYTQLIERVHGSTDKAEALKLHFSLHCFLKITEKKSTRKPCGSDVLVRWAKVVESCNLKACGSAIKDLSKHWSAIVKNVLKHYYLKPQAFRLLQNLCEVMYVADSVDISAKDIHAMVLSHSEFLNVMMEESSETKDNLVEFLLFLVQGEAKCCDSSHISPLLGAYTASLAMTDRRILQMLQVYESAGCDLSSFKPYLWGSAAAEKRAARKGLSQSLLNQASLQDVMEHLSEAMMNESIEHFPLSRQLRPENGLTHKGEIDFSPKIYDPAFFLPLCHQLLGPEFVVDCQHFVMCGLLGFTIAALSSVDAETRSAAYIILKKFYEHLLGARFLGCTQVQYLVLLIRKTGEAEKLRIPSVISAVLCASTKVVLFPTKPLYKVVNKWLTSKSVLDLEHVPLFHTLINSSSPDFEEQRQWMLTSLAHSICDINDIRICKRSYVFKILLSFYNSSLCNYSCQKLILEILSGSVQVRNSHQSLSTSGILEWLTNTLALSPPKPKLSALFIRIISRLWLSFVNCREDESSKEAKEEPRTSAYDSAFTSHILLMCRTLLQNIESFRSLSNLSELSNCLSAVLSHSAKSSQGVGTDRSSSGTEKEDLLLLFHHLHKLTLNSKDFSQLMRFIPQAALGKMPDDSLTQMTDVDQTSPDDHDDSSALASCSNHLLDIVHLWRPGPGSAPEALFFIAQWAFERATAESNASPVLPTVQWFCSLKARPEMLKNAEEPKRLLNMLLRAYEWSANLECRRNLDDFYLQLFKCIDSENVDHPVVKVLSKKAFSKCLHALNEASSECVGILVAEASLGALKPSNTQEMMSLAQ